MCVYIYIYIYTRKKFHGGMTRPTKIKYIQQIVELTG